MKKFIIALTTVTLGAVAGYHVAQRVQEHTDDTNMALSASVFTGYIIGLIGRHIMKGVE